MNNIEIKMRHRIDIDGYFIGDEFTDEINSNLIEVQPREGFYKPKWIGVKWVEGDTEARDLAIANKVPKYILSRIEAYRKLNQDELRYDDMIDGTNTWGEAIESIKAKYPKVLVS